AAIVQAGVALVDVDRHRRVVHPRETGAEYVAVERGGRCEQPLDGDLLLKAIVDVRVHAGWRIKAHDAGGEKSQQVRRLPLHCVCTGLAVGERDRERGREAVTLEVNTSTADAQRVVDLQRVGIPCVWIGGGDLLTEANVGGEHLRL